MGCTRVTLVNWPGNPSTSAKENETSKSSQKQLSNRVIELFFLERVNGHGKESLNAVVEQPLESRLDEKID